MDDQTYHVALISQTLCERSSRTGHSKRSHKFSNASPRGSSFRRSWRKLIELGASSLLMIRLPFTINSYSRNGRREIFDRETWLGIFGLWIFFSFFITIEQLAIACWLIFLVIWQFSSFTYNSGKFLISSWNSTNRFTSSWRFNLPNFVEFALFPRLLCNLRVF